MSVITYKTNQFALEPAKGLPEKVTILTNLSMGDLGMMHNVIIDELKLKDIRPVNKFADKASGAKRVWALLQAHFAEKKPAAPTPKVAAPAPKVAPKAPKVEGEKERKKRGQRFVFPLGDELKTVRPGTNRAKLVEILSKPEGATFEECMAETWGKNKAMTPEIQHKTTYEGIRLLHYYLGYGMKHDMETGIIKIYK